MSKLTTFQELRHKCAKLYCPINWTTITWTNFFADCLKLHTLNEQDKKEAFDEISKAYNCDKLQIIATVTFQRNNGLLGA